jgi:RNA polymerase-binding transcription factor DksA
MAKKKTKYSDKELNQFDKLIDGKLEIARQVLNEYLEQIAGHGDSEDARVRGLDDAITSSENERLYTLARRQKKHIQHLENAKLRIKNKVYGICRESGELISKARLKAVPHATLSIKAKQNR